MNIRSTRLPVPRIRNISIRTGLILTRYSSSPRPYGNIGDPLNYDATEKIGAGYGMVKYTLKEWELIAGVRVEHTNQGYVLKISP